MNVTHLGGVGSTASFAESRFGHQAIVRLRAAFGRSLNPMLIADDQRRWVAGNQPAAELLGMAREQIPWQSIDDFTPAKERRRLAEHWREFLATGMAEAWYELYVPERGSVPVELSATANIVPGRHLAILMPPDQVVTTAASIQAKASSWVTLTPGMGESQLTEREREVIALVASGLQGAAIAKRLYVSPETVKSHVQNAMEKLDAHTRASAVAIALVTGQITWDP